MPTLPVRVTFSDSVRSPERWLEGGDDELLEKPVLSIRCRGGARDFARLKALGEEKRWFHFEFWREQEGVERYSRIAVFGTVRAGGEGARFFVQLLTDDGRQNPEAHSKKAEDIRKNLQFLEDELRRKADDLGGESGDEIEADMSWHELDRESLCKCFGGRRSKAEQEDSHERLQALSLARPVGRIYYMYCFSLAQYFKFADSDRRDFARERNLERRIFKFYVGDDCKFEDERFGVRASADGCAVGQARPRRRAVLVRQRETQLNNDGVDFSLFRTKLGNDERRDDKPAWRWLNNKTYRYQSDSGDEYFLRLSQTGLIEVRQERRLEGGESLAEILEDLLRFRNVEIEDASGAPTTARELNSIVEEFAERLIGGYADDQLGFVSRMNGAGGVPDGRDETRKRQRDRRYVTIVLRDLKCGKVVRPLFARSAQPCERSIRPSDVHRNIEVVSSFLDGTMTYKEDSDKLLIPARPPRASDELPDLSNWSEEICFFESDRALIYFEPKTILESYNHVANYESYWRAVVRGVEHQLSVRTCLQNMETTTTRLTEKIPGLLVGADGEASAPGGKARQNPPEGEADRESKLREFKLKELASDVSEVVSLLPKLRQISTTATAFRSSKAIHKFERLGRECFQFPELVRNIQQNVNELGDFLQYAKAQEMRQALLDLEERIDAEGKDEKRRDDKLVLIGLFIAGSSIFFASFSFLTDADTFFDKYRGVPASPFAEGGFNSPGTKALFVYLYLICCLVLATSLVSTFFGSKSGPERRGGVRREMVKLLALLAMLLLFVYGLVKLVRY